LGVLARFGPGLCGAPAFTMHPLLAALHDYPILPQRGLPSLSALALEQALRGAPGDATITTPGGAGTLRPTHTCNIPRARRTGFSHRVGAPGPTRLRPFALPRPDALSLARPNTRCSDVVCADTNVRGRVAGTDLAGGPGPIGVGLCRLSRRRELRLDGVLGSSSAQGSLKLAVASMAHS
jgi:hypothetical protein